MSKDKDPFYMLEQKEKETRNLLFSVLTENARLIEENKRLRKEKKNDNKKEVNKFLAAAQIQGILVWHIFEIDRIKKIKKEG